MDPTEHADADMKDVLNAFERLNPKPIEDCTPDEARQQPTVTDAVMKLMQERGITPPPAVQQVQSQDIIIPGAAGENPARVYKPAGEGPFPVILYFHGGGFVFADIDVYNATPRSIAAQTNALPGVDSLLVSGGRLWFHRASTHSPPAHGPEADSIFHRAV